MMISRMNSTYENINKNQNADNSNDSLQTKLMAEQRRLKAVDSDANMDAAEKTKEKLKIQQQIDELNRKLKMEELKADPKTGVSSVAVKDIKAEDEKKIETKESLKKTDVKEEKKQDSSNNAIKAGEMKNSQEISKTAEEKSVIKEQLEKDEETKEEEEKSKQDKLGIPPQQLHKMLSADFELQRERVLNRVAENKEETEDVLRAEIKNDEIRGTDTEDKREKLVRMREQKPVQIETIESGKKEAVLKPRNGMKIVIKEDE